jgi:O-antigen ligase
MTWIAFYSLWLFVFTLPWERLVSLPGLYIVSRATGALSLGLTLFAVVMTGRVRRWRAYHVAAFLFVIWAAISVWVSGIPQIPQKYWTFVQLFAVVFMMWQLAPSPERVRRLLEAFALGGFVPAFATIALFVQSHGSLRRFSAAGADPNSLAMTLALVMPIAWYLSLTTERPLRRWIYRSYVPIGLVATALSASRGGLIAWVVALAIIPLTMKLSPGRLAAVMAMMAVSAVILAVYVPENIVERLSTTGSSLGSSVQGGGLGGRVRFWIAGFHAFSLKPLAGYGTGGFIRAITPELGADALVAHNSFISVMVEEGLVGLLLFLFMLLAVFRELFDLPSLERRFALVLFATLGTALLPLTWEDQKSAWYVMAILVGMTAYRGLRGSTVPMYPMPQRAVPMGRRPGGAPVVARARTLPPEAEGNPAP